MVAIRAGTFQRLKFPVTITHDFWMGKYEVTQAEFAAVMGTNTSHFTGDSNRPVEKVSLDRRRGLKNDYLVIDNQLLQLVERLRGDFEVIRAVQYAHAAKKR